MTESQASDRLPPGQVLTEKWPVLTYGATPRVDLRTWTFRCFGLVEEEVSWTLKEFLDLPRVEVTSDIHCVTRWSRFGNRWEGVGVSEILRRLSVRPEAVAVMAHGEQGYTTNISVSDLNTPGLWEVNGYHLHADPWREERYSDQETDAMQRMRSEAARRLRGR